jgi:hypothetical protein
MILRIIGKELNLKVTVNSVRDTQNAFFVFVTNFSSTQCRGRMRALPVALLLYRQIAVADKQRVGTTFLVSQFSFVCVCVCAYALCILDGPIAVTELRF